jgi:hypothetical protein
MEAKVYDLSLPPPLNHSIQETFYNFYTGTTNFKTNDYRMTSTRNKTPRQNRKTYNSALQHGLITEVHNGIFATLHPIPDVEN